jgi:hypothetical protein
MRVSEAILRESFKEEEGVSISEFSVLLYFVKYFSLAI